MKHMKAAWEEGACTLMRSRPPWTWEQDVPVQEEEEQDYGEESPEWALSATHIPHEQRPLPIQVQIGRSLRSDIADFTLREGKQTVGVIPENQD